MATEKRARQKANRQQKVDHVQRLQQRELWRQRVLLGVILAVLVGGALWLFVLSSDDDGADDTSASAAADGTDDVDPADGID